MLAEHHSLTIDATYDLLKYWNKNKYRPNSVNLEKIYQHMPIAYGGTGEGVEIKLEDLRRWVAQADYIEDVVLPAKLTKFVINTISNPTRFQHFAYCRKELLGEGASVVNRYEGYCWDCDHSLPDIFKWRADQPLIKNIRSLMPIARINGKRKLIPIGWINVIRKYLGQKVEYSSYLYPLSEEFFEDSPGVDQIEDSNETVWHDQKYPSAIEMAKFYRKSAGDLKSSGRSDWAVKSLGFATHMLQDMGVYHHVFCKLLDNHSKFEEESLELWRNNYNNGNITIAQISNEVAELLNDQLGKVGTFEDLGEKLVDSTGKRFQYKDTFPEAKERKGEEIRMTAQGIACTIKAIDLF